MFVFQTQTVKRLNAKVNLTDGFVSVVARRGVRNSVEPMPCVGQCVSVHGIEWLFWIELVGRGNVAFTRYDCSAGGRTAPKSIEPAKSLPQIAREIHDLASRARAGTLKPDDLNGGTYTISNNGAFGTVITAPIIHAPQVAIVSTDAVRKKAVVIESPEGDSIAVRPIGVLAQCFDHRAVDGAYAAAFLREVKSVIETRQWAQDMQA